MQEPTIGRIVYFFPDITDKLYSADKQLVPISAMVTHADPPGTTLKRINCTVFPDGAHPAMRQGIPFKTEVGQGRPYWEWPMIKQPTAYPNTSFEKERSENQTEALPEGK